ncbi:type VI secretion system lipoprotein TssJ [Marinobacter lacisalsi]|uniref:Type VI secretion system lipoprotein TssJ n=1 Tax=Marinobacter lacisalsi TaxID=475979 RepID=A0ABV8QE78_9GAMM
MRWFQCLFLVSVVLLNGCAVANYVVDPYTNLSFEASDDINPDASGRASPLVIRVYELRSVDTFRSAGFFDLYDEPDSVLNEDLLSMQEVLLRPELVEKLPTMTLHENTRYLGIVAAFQNIDEAEWKMILDAKPKGYQDIRIAVDGLGLERIRD